jgi:hypothetical protein
MKKTCGAMILMILLVGLMGGCAGEETPQATGTGIGDVSGTYSGTMTMSRVEIVYDYDGAEGQEYAVEGESEWQGFSSEQQYQIKQNEDNTLTLISINEDPSDNVEFTGDYDTETGQFIYELDANNIYTMAFTNTDGVITVTGLMTQTSPLPELEGLKNEVSFELTKI